MYLIDLQSLLQFASNLATVVGMVFGVGGLIVAIRTYKAERNRERLEREYGTFDDLDDKYVEFMYICAQHPNLDLFSIAANSDRQISDDEIKIERALYSVLISIFERAYLMFEQRASKEIKDRQYPGWIKCMKSYCLRDSFQHEWKKIGNQFDIGFQEEMKKLIHEETTEGLKSGLET